MKLETILILLIVAAAGAFLLRRFLFLRRDAGCGSGCSCGSTERHPPGPPATGADTPHPPPR